MAWLASAVVVALAAYSALNGPALGLSGMTRVFRRDGLASSPAPAPVVAEAPAPLPSPSPKLRGGLPDIEEASPVLVKAFEAPVQFTPPGSATSIELRVHIDALLLERASAGYRAGTRVLRESLDGRVFAYEVDDDQDGKFEVSRVDDQCDGKFVTAERVTGAALDLRIPRCAWPHEAAGDRGPAPEAQPPHADGRGG